MREDKEQALAEETQATLAALDVMRKAHEAEVQREVAKFKQELGRRQQSELLELTERLSLKCLEATALEEQLGSASRELAHAQYHILQLERNPQLSMQVNYPKNGPSFISYFALSSKTICVTIEAFVLELTAYPQATNEHD